MRYSGSSSNFSKCFHSEGANSTIANVNRRTKSHSPLVNLIALEKSGPLISFPCSAWERTDGRSWVGWWISFSGSIWCASSKLKINERLGARLSDDGQVGDHRRRQPDADRGPFQDSSHCQPT